MLDADPVETRVIRVDARSPDPEALAEAARLLHAGRLVAFPTETVYGLGAHALDPAAVRRIFAAKGRPAFDPLIVHIASVSAIDALTPHVPDTLGVLADAFWPGPLTVVVERHARVPPEVTAGRDTVAVRVPSGPVARALLEAAALPIAAPSANRFSRPSPTTAQHVLDDLRGRVDLVLDAGPTAIGVESTVLDLTTTPPRVLRPGGIPLEALRAILREVVEADRSPVDPHASLASPGLLLRHYAPRAEMFVVDPGDRPIEDALRLLAAREAQAGKRVGLLVSTDTARALPAMDASIVTTASRANPAAIARRLFAAIRELDAKGVDVILAENVARHGLGEAIADRLFRAAEGRIARVEEGSGD